MPITLPPMRFTRFSFDLTWGMKPTLFLPSDTSITDSPLCSSCMEMEETPIHVMLQCNGVAEQRAAHLDSSVTLKEALGDLGGLLSFWSELGWLE
ncbi:jg10215 [Pararge aegeria aegeria]|uniref:Jg10215 protein n=1 Tax=Pararge aegeria aegeria TaxID=348720 RepID=A0A8S4SL13_9NEOP|nr:jg10215 [Pararge aegeria aegeria]